MRIYLIRAAILSFFFLSGSLYSSSDNLSLEVLAQTTEIDSLESSQTKNKGATAPHSAPNPFPLEESPAPDTDHFFVQLMKMFAILGILIAIMLLASWALKRMVHTRVQQMNVSSAIKVMESRNLSNKSAVYLIEVEDKTLLVGETLHSLSLLATFDNPSNMVQESQK